MRRKNISHLFSKVDYNIKIWFFAGLVLLVIFGLYFFSGDITGRAILSLDADYSEGENLNGILKLSLSSGEFVPALSKVVFEGNGERREFILKDIVVGEIRDEVYYIKGENFSGEGEGYGLEGSKKIFPEVFFKFEVYNEHVDSGDTGEDIGGFNDSIITDIDEELTEKNITDEEPTEEADDEEPTEEELNDKELIKEDIADEELVKEVVDAEEEEEEDEEGALETLSITGDVALDIDTFISGSVFMGEEFIYDLEDLQTAELLLGSVETSSGVIGDDNISFKVFDGKVLAETSYFEFENGFGVDYLGDDSLALEINLSAIGLNFSSGDLKISFVYDEKEFISLFTVLKEGKVKAEETDEDILNKSSGFFVGNLTDSEKGVLIDKFGGFEVVVAGSDIINGRLVERYEIGGYELIASYDYDSGMTDYLKNRIEMDKLNFLRDLLV